MVHLGFQWDLDQWSLVLHSISKIHYSVLFFLWISVTIFSEHRTAHTFSKGASFVVVCGGWWKGGGECGGFGWVKKKAVDNRITCACCWCVVCLLALSFADHIFFLVCEPAAILAGSSSAVCGCDKEW